MASVWNMPTPWSMVYQLQNLPSTKSRRQREFTEKLMPQGWTSPALRHRKELDCVWTREIVMPADTILYNAKIATNGVRSFVEAIAITDGKAVPIGSDREIFKLRGPITSLINANGRTVIPGLNDSHMHPIRAGLSYNMELRWDGVPAVADALRMLKDQAQRTSPPQWVRVIGGWTEFQ